ncbi:MAG: hypothetical protein JWL69_2010 [Phycisphaerales bacterium]|jgi:hypothetical protein|nr:hypothetical protein [Phycisphaerales bacterium]MDB5356801.1 hypothetical protein [Phycisphaerales bacterium]
MVELHATVDVEKLRRVAAGLTEANRRYLSNCVGFWQTIKPDCGVMDWLDYSIHRSRNRPGTAGLRTALAGLKDEELVWLHENHVEAE